MPFDVYSKDGKKLGHITALCGGLLNHYLVELDHSNTLASKINQEKIMNAAYDHFSLRSFTGKIKDKKLESYVESFKAKEQYASFTRMRPEEMVLLDYLCNSYSNSVLNGAHLSKFDPTGKKFMMIQPKFCEYNGRGLVITNDLVDIPELERTHFINDRDFAVISCKADDIVSFSCGELGYFGSGNIAQTGGYNHIHYTNLPLLSGNIKTNVSVKMQVLCREGDFIYLLMDHSFIVRNIYVEGTYYTCNID